MNDGVTHYAGFWRRFLALFLDTLIFIAVWILLREIIKNDFFVLNIIYQTLCAIYIVGLTASKYQGTIGQKLLKVKVGDTQQGRLSIVASAARYLAWGLPFWPMLIYSSMPEAANTVNQANLCDAITDQQKQIECIRASGIFEAVPIYCYILMVIGGLVYSVSIALSKEKAGIYDLICKQRVFKK